MGELLDHLMTRRSIPAVNLIPPGPNEDQITSILRIAARVPDHGKLVPWRFVRYAPEDATSINAYLQSRWLEIDPNAPAERIAVEATRFSRAATIIGVVSKARPHPKIPEWEQFLSAGAVCLNMIHAAFAHGFVAQWLTEWYCDDETASRYLGCAEGERFAGFIYIGTPRVAPTERDRPDVASITSTWTAPAA